MAVVVVAALAEAGSPGPLAAAALAEAGSPGFLVASPDGSVSLLADDCAVT